MESLKLLGLARKVRLRMQKSGERKSRKSDSERREPEGVVLQKWREVCDRSKWRRAVLVIAALPSELQCHTHYKFRATFRGRENWITRPVLDRVNDGEWPESKTGW